MVTEINKVKNKLSPEIMNGVFRIKETSYMLGNSFSFVSRPINTVFNRSESLAHLGPRLWRILPNEFMELKSLALFKNKIKTWVPENFPCLLCKKYVQDVGFL